MRTLATLFGAACLALAALGTPGAQAATVDFGLVTELPMAETYAGHVVHEGRLFVSRSRAVDADPFRVEIYDTATLALRYTLVLPHSAAYIYPYGEHAVVVVGRSTTPYWKTHYTVVSWQGDRYTQRSTTFADEYQVDQAAARGGRMYFGAPGAQLVYRLNGTRNLASIGGSIASPGQMVADDRNLWVIERNTFDFGDEDLVRINVGSGAASRAFASGRRNGLMAVELLEGTPWVAVSEMLENKVLLVDQQTLAVDHEIEVKGGPRGMTRLGSCLVITSESPRLVSFLKLGEEPRLIAQWDLRAVDDRLKQPRHIAVDAASQRVFLRSSYPCGGCSVTQSSVFYAEERDGTTFAQCLAD